ncbi:general transcription factor II-I repeat domain-containing protein 2-like, partial [Tachysurus ichikawai]
MSRPKKRNVDSECRVFNKEWTTKYFFTEVRSMAVCLICKETVAVFKEYNIRRHFATKHANYTSKPQERAATAQTLTANLADATNFFPQTNCDSRVMYQGKFFAGIQISKDSKKRSETCRNTANHRTTCTEKSLQLLSCPLSQDPETASQELQLELIDLQSDSVLKEKFDSLKLNDFYASLNEARFPNLQRMAPKMLTLFGSTYVCEQTFCLMNINTARHRSKFANQHLRSILRINNTVPTETEWEFIYCVIK